jgi:protein SCO1/2
VRGPIFAWTCVVSLMVAGAAAAQPPRPSPAPNASVLPAQLREVGFDQNLNHRLPLDVEFADEHGQTVRLGRYFGSRPVVLLLAYYGCTMLCTQSLTSMASTLGVLALEPGTDFHVVSVSFDPRETPTLALERKGHYVERSGRPEIAPGWHFLTGSEPSIRRLTHSAGFRYVWDESVQQFAHPAGIIVATPDGRISRYLFGIDYGPRDLRLAILDASAQRISSPIEKVLLYCYHYDPTTGRYSLAIMRIVRLAGLVTVLALGTLIFAWTRHERRHQRRQAT